MSAEWQWKLSVGLMAISLALLLLGLALWVYEQNDGAVAALVWSIWTQASAHTRRDEWRRKVGLLQ